MTGRVEHRLLHGSIAAGVGLVLTTLQAIAQVPLLLLFWSADMLSAWLLVNAAVALVLTPDAGHASFVGFELAKRRDEGPAAMKPVLAAGLLGAAILATLQACAAGGAVASGRLAWLVASDGGLPAVPQVPQAFLVLVLYACAVSSFAGIVIRLYPALGLFSRFQWLGNAQRTCMFLGVLSVAVAGGGLLAAATTLVIAGAPFTAWALFDLRNRVTAVWPWWGAPNPRLAIRQIVGSSVLTGIAFVDHATTVALMGLLASTRNVAAVASFATLRTAANLVQQAAMVAVTPVIPEMSRYAASGETVKTASAVSATWMIALAPAATLLTLIAPWMAEMYGSWTLGRLPFLPDVFGCLAAAALLRQFTLPIMTMLASSNRLRSQAIVAVVRAAVTLAVATGGSQGDPFPRIGAGIALGEASAASLCLGLLWATCRGQGTFPFPAAVLALGQVALSLVTVLMIPWSVGSWSASLLLHGVLAVGQWAALPAEVRSRAAALLASLPRRFHTNRLPEGT